MFREPEEETATTLLTKVDKAAATSRSAIRRESTVRPARFVSRPSRGANRAPLTVDPRYNRAARSGPFTESERAQREARDERIYARQAMRWGRSDENEGDDAQRRQAGEELFRDALQHDRPGQRMRLIRPPRESQLRFEVVPSPPLSDNESRTTSPRQRTFTRSYIPSPPYLPTYHQATTRPVPVGERPLSASDAVDLTPDFAPARGEHHGPHRPSASTDEDDLPDLETPPPDFWSNDYPPLRRVGHLSPRLHSSGPDGLGDRRRSPSTSAADDSNMEEDTWETLLTTMEEDEHRPSAESSFTSAIASASTSRRSDSASRSGGSSQTTATTIDFDADLLDPSQPCESDDPHTEADAQYDPSIRSMLRRARPRRQRHEDGPQSPFHHPGEPRSLRARGDEIQVRRRATPSSVASAERRTAAAEERLRNIETRAAEAEAELAQMQSFIDRLARREDIPNEMWAAAGLSSSSRQNGENNENQ